jgi:hypothetical protein
VISYVYNNKSFHQRGAFIMTRYAGNFQINFNKVSSVTTLSPQPPPQSAPPEQQPGASVSSGGGHRRAHYLGQGRLRVRERHVVVRDVARVGDVDTLLTGHLGKPYRPAEIYDVRLSDLERVSRLDHNGPGLIVLFVRRADLLPLLPPREFQRLSSLIISPITSSFVFANLSFTT